MSNIASLGIALMFLGALLCYMNAGGLIVYLKLHSLKTRGVDGEAVSTLQEWIREGHRVYYRIRMPEGSPPATFIEVGVAPRGPVGTVVPVVYDPKRPSRAKTGTRDDIQDLDVAEEWRFVKLVWVPGLSCLAVGAVLTLVFY